MLHDIRLTNTGDRESALDYLKNLRSRNPFLTVMDVGGAHCCWAYEYVTHLVDILPPSESWNPPHPKPTVQCFIGNISNVGVWMATADYVKQHGKFDFLICTHTLEDAGPAPMICDMFGRMAKEGYIATPSKYAELNKHEGNWRGHIHHRWIFDSKNDVVIGYPKQSFLENVPYIEDWVKNNPMAGRTELQYFWKDEVGLRVVNNDHLGPTIKDVLRYYTELVT